MIPIGEGGCSSVSEAHLGMQKGLGSVFGNPQGQGNPKSTCSVLGNPKIRATPRIPRAQVQCLATPRFGSSTVSVCLANRFSVWKPQGQGGKA